MACTAVSSSSRWTELSANFAKAPFETLRNLQTDILQTRTHDIELLRALVGFILNLGLPSQHEPGTLAKAQIELTLQSLLLVAYLCNNIHHDCPCWSVVSLVVLRIWPPVIKWLSSVDFHKENLALLASFFGHMILLNNSKISEQVYGNARALQLILRMWDLGVDHSPLILHELPQCPMSSLMVALMTVHNDPGKLAHSFGTSSCRRERVWRGAHCRVDEIRSRSPRSPFTKPFVVTELLHILLIIQFCPKDHRDWTRIFTRDGLMEQTVGTLSTNMPPSMTTHLWKELKDLLNSVFELVLMPSSGSWSPLRKLECVLRGRFLEVLVITLAYPELEPRAPAQDYAVQTARDMLKHIASYAPYSSILHLLHRFENTVPSRLVSLAKSRSHSNASEYEHLPFMFQSALDSNPMDPDRPPIHLCDSGLHTHWGSLALEVKQCKNCHSVTYCSLECQIADWNNRHRKECKHLRWIHNHKRLHQWLLKNTTATSE
ncbi:hypothetical protein BKA70DRAFT_1435377 [Coprinopsis sp. MPI-PUGE-AT-0042]|nr:hypothetical protein BKA70DRAFT_1435377 [Coprinopsis sp. MPI-PUGE-AT-0042]